MNVLILGDSFTYGHGCSDRIFYYDFDAKKLVGQRLPAMNPSSYCWAMLLQQEFPSWKIFNVASVGRSMQGMFWDFVTFLLMHKEVKPDLVMFNGTLSDRVEMPMLHDFEQAGSWGLSWDLTLPDKAEEEPDVLTNAKHQFRKYLYNKTIGDQHSVSALFGAYGLAMTHDIKFLWSLPFSCLYNKDLFNFLDQMSDNEMPPLMNYDFSGGLSDKNINKSFLCVDGHTNDLGHKVYYQKEILPAVKKTLGV